MFSDIWKMKKRPAIALLVVGLMLATLTPLLSGKFGWPDGARGFVTGLGVGIELIALIALLRLKRMAR